MAENFAKNEGRVTEICDTEGPMDKPQFTIGRYQVYGVLGSGAMGAVYRALDPQLDREVAIKLVQLPDNLPEDEITQMKDGLLHEGRVAAKLNDRGIVQIYDVGEYIGQPFIVLEMLEGRSLEDVLREEAPMPSDRALDLIRQIISSMHYAHERGVIHLDLKPANIMALEDGTTRVMDFGISRTVAELNTPTEEIMGTPYYMSPEQILGLDLDARADLYSVGVMLFRMLSGRLPFESEDFHTLRNQIVNDSPPSLTALVGGLDGKIQALVERSLSKQADERFETMGEFLAALDALNAPPPASGGSTAHYTEGAIVTWDEGGNTFSGIFDGKTYDTEEFRFLVLSPKGKLIERRLPPRDTYRTIGQLPRTVFSRMRLQSEWQRNTIIDHLFDVNDTSKIPKPMGSTSARARKNSTSQHRLKRTERPPLDRNPPRQDRESSNPNLERRRSVRDRDATDSGLEPKTRDSTYSGVERRKRDGTYTGFDRRRSQPNHTPVPDRESSRADREQSKADRESSWADREQSRADREKSRAQSQRVNNKPTPGSMRRGAKFSIQFGAKRWHAVYWGEDIEGTVVAHNTSGDWSLMHLDLGKFADSLSLTGQMDNRELREMERDILQRHRA